jgi:hypothetical protein
MHRFCSHDWARYRRTDWETFEHDDVDHACVHSACLLCLRALAHLSQPRPLQLLTQMEGWTMICPGFLALAFRLRQQQGSQPRVVKPYLATHMQPQKLCNFQPNIVFTRTIQWKLKRKWFRVASWPRFDSFTASQSNVKFSSGLRLMGSTCRQFQNWRSIC